MRTEEFVTLLDDATDKIINIDLQVQDLIKRSSKDGQIKNRKDDILNLITRIAATADRLIDALDDPTQIQDVRYES